HGDEPAAVVGRVGPAPEQVGEGAALNQLHRQKWPAVGQRPEVVDRGNPGVLQLAGNPRLLPEPPDSRAPVVGQPEQSLDADIPIEDEIPSEVDYAHPAPSNLFE